jgi:hypothetical protein
MNFVVGVLILGRVPYEITGGVHLPSAIYVRHPSSTNSSPRFSASTPTVSPTYKTQAKSKNASHAQHNDSQDFIDAGSKIDDGILSEITSSINSSQDRNKATNKVTLSDGTTTPHVHGSDATFSGDEARSDATMKVAAAESANTTSEDHQFLQMEYDIFILLELIMQRDGKLGMGSLWQSHAPIMKLRVYQLDRILNWMLPRLHAHFIHIQMTPEVIVAQWFITMFSYTVPLQWTMQIWGYIFYEGWPGLFRVVLSLLQILEDTILDVDLEGVSNLSLI